MRFFMIARNLLLVVITLALLAGCSISYSSGKSSDSSTSSSTSSSGGDESTKAAEEVSHYMEEISAMTVLSVSQQKDSEEFQRRITDIAISHGITDWEKEDSTFIAMGKGLKRAGVEEESIATLPYVEMFSQSPKYSLILKGYKG